ncbi:antitoxin VapB family protein [Candidatus Woesearchaeota archaeon]|nr:antitoxin VapB family protein [Candidatus Woesearchaeota archaeon]
MAKTIMISNDVYERLKNIKEREDKSFSEVVIECLDSHKKTGKDLMKCFGILKDDKEYDKIMKDTRKRWAEWTKKYA